MYKTYIPRHNGKWKKKSFIYNKYNSSLASDTCYVKLATWNGIAAVIEKINETRQRAEPENLDICSCVILGCKVLLLKRRIGTRLCFYPVLGFSKYFRSLHFSPLPAGEITHM